jgi:primosomal protein N'
VDSPLITGAIRQDYKSFYLSELKVRKVLSLPPYTNMAFLIFSSSERHLSEEYADIAYRLLSKTSMTVYAPSKAGIAKLHDKIRTRVIVKHKDTKEFMENITKAYLFMIKKLPGKVTMSIDVFKDEFDVL